MKFYVFDDTLLISGANLSEDYFNCRQDRYYCVQAAEALCDFYAGLLDVVARHSFQVIHDGGLRFDGPVNPRQDTLADFRSAMQSDVADYLEASRLRQLKAVDGGTEENTFIFPFVQMGPYGIEQDTRCMKAFLEERCSSGQLHVASGYFNLTEELSAQLLQPNRGSLTVLCAAPSANGFLNAPGAAGFIPHLYTELERRFAQRLATSVADNAQLLEYRRTGWTFHAKGMWLAEVASPNLCFATTVGSSNYGYRSAQRDLESQMAVLTNCPYLAADITAERDFLFADGHRVSGQQLVSKERRPPFWLKFCVPLVKRWAWNRLFQ